jgi:hypothetical protein
MSWAEISLHASFKFKSQQFSSDSHQRTKQFYELIRPAILTYLCAVRLMKCMAAEARYSISMLRFAVVTCRDTKLEGSLHAFEQKSCLLYLFMIELYQR